ncbi:hypothetical protein CJF30_00003318 [Rutstroemia sp. NJR-2017a BBW]|nr:hypothetical protein CJF30_00003318 [Rutstroemia sp. NJR-2017a BBW]
MSTSSKTVHAASVNLEFVATLHSHCQDLHRLLPQLAGPRLQPSITQAKVFTLLFKQLYKRLSKNSELPTPTGYVPTPPQLYRTPPNDSHRPRSENQLPDHTNRYCNCGTVLPKLPSGLPHTDRDCHCDGGMNWESPQLEGWNS